MRSSADSAPSVGYSGPCTVLLPFTSLQHLAVILFFSCTLLDLLLNQRSPNRGTCCLFFSLTSSRSHDNPYFERLNIEADQLTLYTGEKNRNEATIRYHGEAQGRALKKTKLDEAEELAQRANPASLDTLDTLDADGNPLSEESTDAAKAKTDGNLKRSEATDMPMDEETIKQRNQTMHDRHEAAVKRQKEEMLEEVEEDGAWFKLVHKLEIDDAEWKDKI